jgi:signal transduction histidine kinase
VTFKAPVFVAGTLLVAIVAVLVTVERLIGAPQHDLELLALALTASGVLSLGLGTLALRLAGSRITSLRWRVALASGVGLLVALVNVLATSALMFLSPHDLTLLVLLLAFAGVVSLAFGNAVAGSITAELQALSRTAGRLAGGDLGARVGARGADEVARLGAAFDHMADQLQHAFERERALESDRRELVTAVSHDLRTPLATTRAMVEALTDGVVTDRADVDRYLRLIRREIAHLSRLIDDLFELSQIETGALHLRPRVTDLADLVAETVAAHQAPAAAQGVALTDDLDPRLGGVRVHVDPDRLQRVLHNLLDNALRHTPPGGLVQVAARLAEGEVELSVCDSGPGIPAEEQERIFERFYRAERARQRGGADGAPTAGAGLGLAIARALVHAHRGRIWAEASPLGGASLHVTLPVHLSGSGAGHAAHLRPGRGP